MMDVTRFWFQIAPWMDEARTGPYPSIERIKANVPEFPYFELPQKSIEIESMTLDEHTTLTDAIFENGNKGGSVWVVSKKLKTILQAFNLPAHKFYKINTTFKGESSVSEEYYLLNVFEDILDQMSINYSESTFKAVPYVSFLSPAGLSTPVVMAKSKLDCISMMKEQSNQLNDVNPHILILREGIKYDLFAFRPDKYYVSNSLANELISQGVTGFDVVPVDFEIRITS